MTEPPGRRPHRLHTPQAVCYIMQPLPAMDLRTAPWLCCCIPHTVLCGPLPLYGRCSHAAWSLWVPLSPLVRGFLSPGGHSTPYCPCAQEQEAVGRGGAQRLQGQQQPEWWREQCLDWEPEGCKLSPNSALDLCLNMTLNGYLVIHTRESKESGCNAGHTTPLHTGYKNSCALFMFVLWIARNEKTSDFMQSGWTHSRQVTGYCESTICFSVEWQSKLLQSYSQKICNYMNCSCENLNHY